MKKILAFLLAFMVVPALGQGINPITPPSNWLVQVRPPASANPSDFYASFGSVGSCTGCASGGVLFSNGGVVKADSGFTYAGAGGPVALTGSVQFSTNNQIFTAVTPTEVGANIYNYSQFGFNSAAGTRLDQELIQGWNVSANGQPVSSLDDFIGMTFESHYEPDTSHISKEWYIQYFPAGYGGTVTFTNSSAVISYANTFTAGQPIQFVTTGALPTNFAINTTYYVIATGLTTSQFEVSATKGGSAITAGSAGSGTQQVLTTFVRPFSVGINQVGGPIIAAQIQYTTMNFVDPYGTSVAGLNVPATNPVMFINGSANFSSVLELANSDNLSTHLWRFQIPSTAGSAARAGNLEFLINSGNQSFTLTQAGSVVVGYQALATNATDGFFYAAGGAGSPTGTPTTQNTAIPMYVDTLNSQLWMYLGGAWKQPKTPAGAALVTWQ